MARIEFEFGYTERVPEPDTVRDLEFLLENPVTGDVPLQNLSLSTRTDLENMMGGTPTQLYVKTALEALHGSYERPQWRTPDAPGFSMLTAGLEPTVASLGVAFEDQFIDEVDSSGNADDIQPLRLARALIDTMSRSDFPGGWVDDLEMWPSTAHDILPKGVTLLYAERKSVPRLTVVTGRALLFRPCEFTADGYRNKLYCEYNPLDMSLAS